ncbi:MAG: hypothetical protein JEZ04_09085 [Spirochaetales bacterium]|nr:hypothetical protein [Spirochaetales bacterium]
MKLKIITLTFILIIGTKCFSEEIFLSGGFGLSPQVQLSSFDGKTLKPQAKINADAAFFINFFDTFSAGLSAGLIYTLSSDINGGWSYPGFDGFEAGLELLYHPPFFPDGGIGGGVTAGWYRYNLTTSLFFLPSFSLFPSWRYLQTIGADFFLDLPVTVYIHQQADLFLSTGIRLRMLLK